MEDTPGGGVTMVVGLPEADGGVTRVLVVDDEPQILRALATNLRARDFEVDLARTGEEALQRAADHHPDLVILDLGLPDLDGVEVVAGLRGWTNVPDHRAVGPRRRGATRSPRSTPVPTTTSPSRSA